MKTLIILAHPDIAGSRVNRRWKDEILKHADKFELHELYSLYPNFKIDVAKEQKLLETHDKIVLQYPLYWSNFPPLLKKWFDDVFAYGWAYGTGGTKLNGKLFSLAISAGAKEDMYSKDGIEGFSLQEVLSPFKATLNFVGAKPMADFASYGFLLGASDEDVENSAKEYIDFLLKL